jgi:hypothetical protein
LQYICNDRQLKRKVTNNEFLRGEINRPRTSQLANSLSDYRPAFLGTDYLVAAVAAAAAAAGTAVCPAADCAGDSVSRGSSCSPAR